MLDSEHLEGIARVCTYGRIWMLGINNTKTPLMISDHPIVLRSHDPHPFYRSPGWIAPYVEIGIPISPSLIILLFCPAIFRERSKFGSEWLMNNTVVELNEEHVLYYNSLQWGNSYRFLLSSVNDWETLEEYLSEFPELKNPNRQKVSVSGFGRNMILDKDWRIPKRKK